MTENNSSTRTILKDVLKSAKSGKECLKLRPLINKATSQYKPIAPAPLNKTQNTTNAVDLINSSIIQSQSSNATWMLPPSNIQPNVNLQTNSYLTQGANGTMYLVTNPAPTINAPSSPILVANQNGILQLVQQPQPQNTFLIGNPQNIPTSYMQSPIFNPFLSQQLPMIQMSTLQNHPSSIIFPNQCQPILHDPFQQQQNIEQHTNIQSNQISPLPTLKQNPNCLDPMKTSDSIGSGDKNLAPKDSVEGTQVKTFKNKITFESGSFSENTVSYQNETGQTIKLDILERAILTIPGLSK